MFKFFKKRKKADHKNSNRYFTLKIKEVRKETEDTNTLVFEKPERHLNYLPGQFLTLILPIKDNEVRRSYSLCTSPHNDEFPAITVKRVDSGVVSNYLNDHMKAGDIFEIMEPAGHFVPELNEDHQKKYTLFAAGSGITPLMSIIKSILIVEPKSTVTLVYQNRNENSIIFKEELTQIQSEYSSRFSQIDVLSQPQGEWTGYHGRLNTAMVSDILMDIYENKISQADYYLCGPAGFMATIFDTLIEFDVSDKHIHKESFYSGEITSPKTEPSPVGVEGHEVSILLDGEAYELMVPPNKTILEAALDKDIDMPFSCQSGLCTACRGKLLQGNVEMAEDDGLSEEELNEGYILNCMSKPTGPGVKIEIG